MGTMGPKMTVLASSEPRRDRFGQFRSCLQAIWHTRVNSTACRCEVEQEVEGAACSLSPSFLPFFSSDMNPATSAPPAGCSAGWDQSRAHGGTKHGSGDMPGQSPGFSDIWTAYLQSLTLCPGTRQPRIKLCSTVLQGTWVLSGACLQLFPEKNGGRTVKTFSCQWHMRVILVSFHFPNENQKWLFLLVFIDLDLHIAKLLIAHFLCTNHCYLCSWIQDG